MNWTLHLLLKKALERYGIQVKLTRETQNTALDVYERGTASRDCDLLLSLHSNAAGAGVNEAVDYVVIYVPQDGSGSEIGQILADGIWYRIQTGAFRVKANADAYLAEIKAAGIEGYITV